jgi:hypothetical protein
MKEVQMIRKMFHLFFTKRENYIPLSEKAYYEQFKFDTQKVPETDDYMPIASKNTEMLKEAYNRAWKNRNFEIDKFWLRSAYFWGFISVIFIGYATILAVDNCKITEMFLDFYLILIGLLFSLAWFLVIKGSKIWQENWEAHIDYLEDFVSGPIYKTVFCPVKHRFYSVSKINEVVALIVIIVWIGLVFQYMNTNNYTFSLLTKEKVDLNITIPIGLVVIFSIVLIFGYPVGKYKLDKSNINKKIQDSGGAFISRW